MIEKFISNLAQSVANADNTVDEANTTNDGTPLGLMMAASEQNPVNNVSPGSPIGRLLKMAWDEANNVRETFTKTEGPSSEMSSQFGDAPDNAGTPLGLSMDAAETVEGTGESGLSSLLSVMDSDAPVSKGLNFGDAPSADNGLPISYQMATQGVNVPDINSAFETLVVEPYRTKVSPRLSATLLVLDPTWRKENADVVGDASIMDSFFAVDSPEWRKAKEDATKLHISPGRATILATGDVIGNFTGVQTGVQKVDWADGEEINTFFNQGAPRFWSGTADLGFNMLDPWMFGPGKVAKGVKYFTKAPLTAGNKTKVLDTLYKGAEGEGPAAPFFETVAKASREDNPSLLEVDSRLINNPKASQIAVDLVDAFRTGGNSRVADLMAVGFADESALTRVTQQIDELSVRMTKAQAKRDGINDYLQSVFDEMNSVIPNIESVDGIGRYVTPHAKEITEERLHKVNTAEDMARLRDSLDAEYKDLATHVDIYKRISGSYGTMGETTFASIPTRFGETVSRNMEEKRAALADDINKGIWGIEKTTTGSNVLYWTNPSARLGETPANMAQLSGPVAARSAREAQARIKELARHTDMTPEEARAMYNTYIRQETKYGRYQWFENLELVKNQRIIEKAVGKETIAGLDERQLKILSTTVSEMTRATARARRRALSQLLRDENYTIVYNGQDVVLPQMQELIDQLAQHSAMEFGRVEVTAADRKYVIDNLLRETPGMESQVPGIHIATDTALLADWAAENTSSIKYMVSQLTTHPEITEDGVRRAVRELENQITKNEAGTITKTASEKGKASWDAVKYTYDTYMNTVWKPLTLLSFRYTTRNIAEGWGRVLALATEYHDERGYGYAQMARDFVTSDSLKTARQNNRVRKQIKRELKGSRGGLRAAEFDQSFTAATQDFTSAQTEAHRILVNANDGIGVATADLSHIKASLDGYKPSATNAFAYDEIVNATNKIINPKGIVELEQESIANAKALGNQKNLLTFVNEQRSTGATIDNYGDQAGSLLDYTSGSGAYSSVNTFLRSAEDFRALNPSKEEFAATKKVIRDIDFLISKSKGVSQPITTYRGIKGKEFSDQILALNVGETFVDTGYASTTHSEKIASNFAKNNVVLEIVNPAGTKGVSPNAVFGDLTKETIANGSYQELEWILPRGTEFKVVSKSGNKVKVVVTNSIKKSASLPADVDATFIKLILDSKPQEAWEHAMGKPLPGSPKNAPWQQRVSDEQMLRSLQFISDNTASTVKALKESEDVRMLGSEYGLGQIVNNVTAASNNIAMTVDAAKIAVLETVAAKGELDKLIINRAKLIASLKDPAGGTIMINGWLDLPDSYSGAVGQIMKGQVSSSASTSSTVLNARRNVMDDMLGRNVEIKTVNPTKPTAEAGKFVVNPNWAAAHTDYINTKIANSGIAQQIFAGQTDDEIYKWLHSQDDAAIIVRKNLDHTLDSYPTAPGKKDAWYWVIKRDRAEIESLLPRFDAGNNSLAELRTKAAEGKFTVEDSMRIPEVLRTPVSGLDTDIAHRSVFQIYRNIINGFFNKLATQPEDAFVRHPFYRTVYRNEARRFAEIIKDSGLSKEEMLLRVQDRAHSVAYQQVMERLYSIERYTNPAEFMKFVSPFYMAQQNSARFWTGAMIRQPNLPGRMLQLWNTPDRAFDVTDKNGKPVEWSLPWNSNGQTIMVPIPEKLQGMFGGNTKFSASKSSFDLIFQGEIPFKPQFSGPMVDVPMTWIVWGTRGTKADIDNFLTNGLGLQPDFFVNYVQPYYKVMPGSTPGAKTLEAFKPTSSWMRALLTATVGMTGVSAGDQYSNSFADRWDAAYRDELQKRIQNGEVVSAQEDIDIFNAAHKKATISYLWETIFAAGAPIAPVKVKSDLNLMRQELYGLQAELGYDEGSVAFAARYPDGVSVASIVGGTGSDNKFGFSATPQTIQNLKKYAEFNDDVTRFWTAGGKGGEPKILSVFMNAGDYSKDRSTLANESLYAMKINGKNIKVKGSSDAADKANAQVTAGWNAYFNTIEKLDLDQKAATAAGNAMPKSEYDALKTSIKEVIAERFPLWGDNNGFGDRKRAERDYKIIYSFLNNEKYMKETGDKNKVVQAAKDYFINVRPRMIRDLQGEKFTDSSPMATIRDQVIEDIKTNYNDPNVNRFFDQFVYDDRLEIIDIQNPLG